MKAIKKVLKVVIITMILFPVVAIWLAWATYFMATNNSLPGTSDTAEFYSTKF